MSERPTTDAAAKWLIIDGNNLLYHDAELTRVASSDFEQARRRLAQKLDELAGSLNYDRVIVVFDGRGAAVQAQPHSKFVEVLFSPANLTADSVIERLAHDAPDPSRITVVTSDRGERDTVEAAGGSTMSCSNFLELLERRRREVAQTIRHFRQPGAGGRLGDFFP